MGAPVRTTPLVCADLNDGVGLVKSEAGVFKPLSDAIGDVAAALEHHSSTAWRRLCEDWHVAMVNTFYEGYTFSGPARGRRDHTLLLVSVMVVPMHPELLPKARQVQWNLDECMVAMRQHKGKHTFLQTLESKCSLVPPRALEEEAGPDEVWDDLAGAVRDASLEHFGLKRYDTEDIESATAARKCLLMKRAAIRATYALEGEREREGRNPARESPRLEHTAAARRQMMQSVGCKGGYSATELDQRPYREQLRQAADIGRIIHVTCPVGKAYTSVLMARPVREKASPMDFGLVPRRSREGALVTTAVVAERAAHYGLTTITSFRDLSKAFRCPSLEDMEQGLDQMLLDEDADNVKQRVRDYHCEVETAEGILRMKTGQGVLIGDSVGPPLFLEVFSPVALQWAVADSMRPDTEMLEVRSIVSQMVLDLSLTKDADDLCKRFVSWCHNTVVANHKASDSLLDRLLEPRGYAQNITKQHTMCAFRGPGARAQTRAFYGNKLAVRGNCSVVARYLGPMLHYRGAQALELKARVAAAARGFWEMGRFWKSEASVETVRQVFRSKVLGTLLSWAAAVVPTSSWLSTLRRAAIRLGRSALGARATRSYLAEEGYQHRAMPTQIIRQMLQMADVEQEIRAMRLGFYIRMLRQPLDHEIEPTALFGQLPFALEEIRLADGRLGPGASPMARCLVEDVRVLLVGSEQEDLLAEWEMRPMRLLASGALRDEKFYDWTQGYCACKAPQWPLALAGPAGGVAAPAAGGPPAEEGAAAPQVQPKAKGATKRGAKRLDDFEETLKLLARLVLIHDLQIRDLESATYLTIKLLHDHPVVKAVKDLGKAYSAACHGKSPKVHTSGLRPGGLVREMHEKFTDRQSLYEVVTFFKHKDMHDQRHCRLCHEVVKCYKMAMLKVGAVQLQGSAPPNGLYRALQQWVSHRSGEAAAGDRGVRELAASPIARVEEQ
ncbi:unnamed protein product [Prorocentrum cordatum]|uniref:RNA-directed RNA polymerase n=1 Tax=Prorocentrum cordatum TaxID=2364126 RepID=A0ABN9RP73_9DINO|nr:unnamed protein product [Polarella glacialis]